MRDHARAAVHLATTLVGPGATSALLLLALAQSERLALALARSRAPRVPRWRRPTMTMTRKTAFVATALVGMLALAGVALAHGGGWRSPPATFAPADDGALNGRFVTFTPDVAAGTLLDLDVKRGNGTQLVFASVRLVAADGAGFSANATRGGYVLADGAGDVLRVEDSPRLRVDVRSRDGATLVLVLPEGASATRHAVVEGWSPEGATIRYADGQQARLVLHNASLDVDGQTLTVTLDEGGGASFGLVGDKALRGGGHFGAPGFGGHGPRGGHHARGGHR